MMSAASRHHLARCAGAMLVATLLLAGAAWGYRAFQARALVERLRAAEIAHVPAIIRELGPFRRQAAGLLDAIASDAARPRSERLHATLALVHWDRANARSLIAPLLEGGPGEARVTSEELRRPPSRGPGTAVAGGVRSGIGAGRSPSGGLRAGRARSDGAAVARDRAPDRRRAAWPRTGSSALDGLISSVPPRMR